MSSNCVIGERYIDSHVLLEDSDKYIDMEKYAKLLAKKEKARQYYQANKEHLKQYYKEHRDMLKLAQKEYNEKNREKVAEYQKEYYQTHRKERLHEISSRNKEKCMCECGRVVARSIMTKHKKTALHEKQMALNGIQKCV